MYNQTFITIPSITPEIKVVMTPGFIGQSGYSGFSGYSGDSSGSKVLITNVHSTYIVLSTDECIVATSGTFTITLPTATASGRVIKIKNIGAGIVTVDGNNSDTIDGELTQILNQYDGVTLIDNGNNSWIIS